MAEGGLQDGELREVVHYVGQGDAAGFVAGGHVVAGEGGKLGEEKGGGWNFGLKGRREKERRWEQREKLTACLMLRLVLGYLALNPRASSDSWRDVRKQLVRRRSSQQPSPRPTSFAHVDTYQTARSQFHDSHYRQNAE